MLFDGDGRGEEREGEKEEGDSWRDFYGNNYGLIVDAWIFFSFGIGNRLFFFLKSIIVNFCFSVVEMFSFLYCT